MCGPGTGVIGIVVGLVAVSCYVGILSRPWFQCLLLSVGCVCGLGSYWEFLFWRRKGLAIS